MKGLLKGFKAPLGVYALMGNHDLWADGPAMRKALEDDGIRVLQNEVVTLKRRGKTLAIMGADDIWVGERNDQPMLDAKGDAKILLAHQPDHFYLSVQTGAQLKLSRHTHATINSFPFTLPLHVPPPQRPKP